MPVNNEACKYNIAKDSIYYSLIKTYVTSQWTLVYYSLIMRYKTFNGFDLSVFNNDECNIAMDSNLSLMDLSVINNDECNIAMDSIYQSLIMTYVYITLNRQRIK